MAVPTWMFACSRCGLAIETLGPANSPSLFDPRCTECGGALEEESEVGAASPAAMRRKALNEERRP